VHPLQFRLTLYQLSSSNLLEKMAEDPERHARDFKKYLAACRVKKAPEQKKFLPVTRLSRWQWDVLKRLLDHQQNNQKILFVVDTVGNRGKTFLSLYMEQKYGDTHLTLAETKQNNMAYAVSQKRQLRTVIFDYSRNWKPESFAWNLFQQLKNRRVLSGRCNKVVTEFPANINVAVFTNYDPTDHLSGVSKDWISVINLDDEFKLRGQEILELLDLEPSP
jgi:hypothetical protein